MTLRSRILLYAGVFASLLSFCAAASAAEEGSAYPSDASGGVFLWINFIILAGGIIWVVRKHGRPAFRRNAQKIGFAIAKAAEIKAQAEEKLREAEARLAQLGDEVAALQAEAQREAAAEAERIRALAKAEAVRIAQAAKEEIAAAERATRLELKAIAAKLAVDGAESLLPKQLTPQAQNALFSDFVEGLNAQAGLPGRAN
jgi:F-type H+-transporting ATPase subunit b